MYESSSTGWQAYREYNVPFLQEHALLIACRKDLLTFLAFSEPIG